MKEWIKTKWNSFNKGYVAAFLIGAATVAIIVVLIAI